LVQVDPGEQVAHSPPGKPHAASVLPGWQTLFWSQQPLGQFPMQVELWQAFATQLSPPGQAAHVLPPAPHAFTVLPVWQCPEESQQPVGHVIGLQLELTHAPAVHASPEGQTEHVPP
jgi:hypothetical protein